jgi:pimeloyl-ACP methyl ester carboxylesterase
MVMLVHGSVLPGWGTWAAQRPLADDYRLIVPHRTGYPPNPPLERIDFDVQAGEIAELIEPGTHLVGHSYGGVVSLLAAAKVPERLRSLTVIEPPAFGVARGNPDVEAFVERVAEHYAIPDQTPREFALGFVALVGATPNIPEILPPDVEASLRASMVERDPTEADISFDAIRDAPFRVLVVSGGHHPAFDAVCDVLEERLGAQRAVIPGSGHSAQRTGAPFNDRLREFIDTA